MEIYSQSLLNRFHGCTGEPCSNEISGESDKMNFRKNFIADMRRQKCTELQKFIVKIPLTYFRARGYLEPHC